MDVAPAEVVTLKAQKIGFLGGEYGQRHLEDPGQTLTIRDDEWVQNVALPLWPAGAIEGRVFDHRGVPLIGVTVKGFLRVPFGGGARHLAAASAQTDDLGRYRLVDLSPGDYTVGVLTSQVVLPESSVRQYQASSSPLPPGISVGNSRVLVLRSAPLIGERNTEALAYPTTFAPSSRSLLEAARITVQGTEKGDVDIQLRVVPVFTVRGYVEAPRDVLGDLTLRLVRADDHVQGMQVLTAATGVDREGRFVLMGVPAGEYVLEALPHVSELRAYGASANDSVNPMRILRPSPLHVSSLSFFRRPLELATLRPTLGPDGWWGRRPVSVEDRDVDGVTFVAEPTSRLTGRIVVEEKGPIAGAQPRRSQGALSTVVLMLDPADGRLEVSGEPVAEITESGEFTIRGVLPGKYFFRTVRQSVKTVEWRGRNHADIGIQVTGEHVQGLLVVLTDDAASISGAVTDGNIGRAATDGAVLCFPVEPEQWQDFGVAPRRIRAARVGGSGRYVIDQLPAGDYYLAALPPAEMDRWHEPEYLRKLAGNAQRVTIRWGESVTRDLRRLGQGRRMQR